jgi:hypothetical protein
MRSGLFWQAFSWLSTPTLAAVAAILLARKLQRDFPLFVFYVLLLFGSDIARFIAYYGTPLKSYYYVYWITDAMATLFALLATGELMFKRLFPEFYRVRFYRYLFAFAGVLITTFACVTALSSKPYVLLSAFISVVHTAEVLLVAMLAFFVGLMIFMGRRWRKYEFGIALGLGVGAAALLLTLAMAAKSGALHGIARQTPVVGENAEAIIWLLFFLKPEKTQSMPGTSVDPEVLHRARELQEALQDTLPGKKRSQ